MPALDFVLVKQRFHGRNYPSDSSGEQGDVLWSVGDNNPVLKFSLMVVFWCSYGKN